MNDYLTAADFIAACEVEYITVSEFLRKTTGAHMDVPRISGHKVVPLKAMPEDTWELVA